MIDWMVQSVKQGILEALKAIGISIISCITSFLDQFLLFIFLFIILANIVGFKELNKYGGLIFLVWLLFKVVVS